MTKTKRFKVTGACIPDKHWMADISGKITEVMHMVRAGDYFVINRPRQYGKTTLLFMLEKELLKTGEFLPLSISFEGIDTLTHKNQPMFISRFLGKLKQELNLMGKQELAAVIDKESTDNLDFYQLDLLLEKLNSINQTIVLMIDEVDKSSNNQLFLDFLAMLRDKYLAKDKGKAHTFHSVILAGVHDVKSLKSKIRPEDEQKFNSPWNIAADFEVDMALNTTEIASMLRQYAENKDNLRIDIPVIADWLFYYTSGYPFLVSYLCKQMDEKILPAQKEGSRELTVEHVREATAGLLKSSNTNFDSLIKNLENNPGLYDFVKSIAVEGESISYHVTDNLVSQAKTYGMIGEDRGICKIHNKIYEQLIHDHMMLKLLREKRADKISHYNIAGNFTRDDGSLDFEAVLVKFAQFMKEQYSEKDRDFLERNGRLVFQAFLKPIINGTGFDFKEAQISEERRLDITVTWGRFRYVMELKIWRGAKAHEKGLLQLVDYLERLNLRKGYLIIFDTGKNLSKIGTRETVTIAGKEIFTVRV